LAPDHQSAAGCGCRLIGTRERLESSPSFRRHSSSSMTACRLPWASTSLSALQSQPAWRRADGRYPVRSPRSYAGHDGSLAVFLVGGRVPICGHSGPGQGRGRCQEVACPPHNGTLQRWIRCRSPARRARRSSALILGARSSASAGRSPFCPTVFAELETSKTRTLDRSPITESRGISPVRFNVTTQLGPHREITLQSLLLWSLQRETLASPPTIKTGGYRG
jgi:hypothetical protein